MTKVSAARAPGFPNPRARATGGSCRLTAEPPEPTTGLSFPLRPLQVTWEITQSCNWKSASARAAARARNKQELSTAEAFQLIDEVATLHVPLLAVTGGDPLWRGDLVPILQYASRRSVRTSLTLLPTPLLTRDVVSDLKDCGLMRAAFWLHGSTALLHDPWSAAGAYRRTLEAIGWCHELGLQIQVNTTMVRRNLHDLNSAIDLLSRLDVGIWNVFFFVPPSPDQAGELLTAEEHEEVFAKLFAASGTVHFQIKTTEGQHYQRFILQKRARTSGGQLTEAESITSGPRGVNDGKALVFINYAGEVYPSRFLPLSCGNIQADPLSRIYCDSPLFVSLRDSSQLKGKCGRCPVRNVCGGSRARAYALTGDVFAEDPGCAYQP